MEAQKNNHLLVEPVTEDSDEQLISFLQPASSLRYGKNLKVVISRLSTKLPKICASCKLEQKLLLIWYVRISLLKVH